MSYTLNTNKQLTQENTQLKEKIKELTRTKQDLEVGLGAFKEKGSSLEELQEALKEYQGKIERIILTGGGANLLGIEDYCSKQLGLPAVKGAPFNRVSYPPSLEPMVGELGPSLAVASGLGIKEFI